MAGAASGVILTHEPAPGHAASYSAPPLPASFTASDGAAYRRLAITPVTGPNQRSASLTITPGSDPVDVMATCDHRQGTTFVLVTVNGSDAGFADCQGPERLTGVLVHPGQRARITFAAGSPIGSRIAGWQFAAYAWTPPASPGPRPPNRGCRAASPDPPSLPPAGTRSGAWSPAAAGTGPPTRPSASRCPSAPAPSGSA